MTSIQVAVSPTLPSSTRLLEAGSMLEITLLPDSVLAALVRWEARLSVVLVTPLVEVVMGVVTARLHTVPGDGLSSAHKL